MSLTPEELEKLTSAVDGTTRARCAALSARGLSDLQIADILLLTFEQVVAVHETEEFKKKYAEEADRAIQDQIDRDEGWDGVESAALGVLLDTMRYNRDPKFALVAAKTANAAERRARNNQPAKVIDSTQPGNNTTNNIVFLQINKNYATRENSQIDITPRPAQIPLKQSDMPAPKLVDELLAPAKKEAGQLNTKVDTSDLKEMFKQAGVVFDQD